MRSLLAKSPSLAAWAGAIALGLLCAFSPRPAEAVTVTVGNFVYDLTPLATGQSFRDANASGALAAVPWWGDGGLANSLADAYALVVGPSATPVRFAFGTVRIGNSPNFRVQSYDVTTAGTVQFVTSNWRSGGGVAFVTGTRVPVPEIDGPALARAALIVLALWVALVVARGRRASAALSSEGVSPCSAPVPVRE